MKTQAIIFDFDGTVLDTESCEYESWREVYREHGCELTLADWLPCVGAADLVFDPLEGLEARCGKTLDREAIGRKRDEAHLARLEALTVLAGVAETIAEARQRGLKLGVASSSSRRWVEGHLERLGLLEGFEVVRCRDDVRRAKPDPELFTAALAALGVTAKEALAIEDSLPGVQAAKAAGIYTVAVPGPMTRSLAFGEADVVLENLLELPLDTLISKKEASHA